MDVTYFEEDVNKNLPLVKTFLWMFYAIFLTAVVSVFLPYILVGLNAEGAYYPMMIIGSISLFVLAFAGQFVIGRTQSKPLAITIFSLFAVAMGVTISPTILLYGEFLGMNTIGIALLVTSLIFGIMALYGYFTKRDLSSFGSMLMMLLFGCIIISFINIFVASSSVDWIISYVILAVYIGFVAYDIQKVKRLANNGYLTFNVSLLMALNLYIDFVYIFIRILQVIARSKDN